MAKAEDLANILFIQKALFKSTNFEMIQNENFWLLQTQNFSPETQTLLACQITSIR